MWYLHWTATLWATLALEVAADALLIVAVWRGWRAVSARFDRWYEGRE